MTAFGTDEFDAEVALRYGGAAAVAVDPLCSQVDEVDVLAAFDDGTEDTCVAATLLLTV